MEKKEKPIEQKSHRPAAALKFWLTVILSLKSWVALVIFIIISNSFRNSNLPRWFQVESSSIFRLLPCTPEFRLHGALQSCRVCDCQAYELCGSRVESYNLATWPSSSQQITSPKAGRTFSGVIWFSRRRMSRYHYAFAIVSDKLIAAAVLHSGVSCKEFQVWLVGWKRVRSNYFFLTKLHEHVPPIFKNRHQNHLLGGDSS